MTPERVAFFISPHGMGHAGRACAVMEALRSIRPGIGLDIYTTVPDAFFRDSLGAGYERIPLDCDVGLVQKTPFEEDLPATADRVDTLLARAGSDLQPLAMQLRDRMTRLVVCDIAPLGLLAARQAGLPSVLVENFTWDWIYAGYLGLEPRLQPAVRSLAAAFASATHHVQTEPICRRAARPSLVTPPVSRRTRLSRRAARRLLGAQPDRPLVLVSVSGLQDLADHPERLRRHAGIDFVLPGTATAVRRDGNLISIPYSGALFHPDAVLASDAVVGKLGYSTLAEVYAVGVPFGFIYRPLFPESGPLSEYVLRSMSGIAIAAAEFESGAWTDRVPELLEQPRQERDHPEAGARAVAEFLDGVID